MRLAALFVAAALVAGCSGDPGPRPPAASSPPSRQAAGETVADALERALRTNDGPGAAALGAPGAATVDTRLRAAAANVEALGVEGLTLDYRAASDGGSPASGRWDGVLEVSWRPLPGEGRTSLDVPVGLEWVGDHASIASVADGAVRLPLWLAGPVQVRRGPGWRVVVRDAGGPTDELAQATRSAVAGIGRVLPVGGPIDVELPADPGEYAATLGSRPGEFDALVAVTTTVDGSVGRRAPQRVVVNPGLLPTLDADGLALVLAHEIVHVALRDVTTPGPRWLSEGYADHVALRALRVRPVTSVAAELARARGVPAGLPTAADFTRSGRALEAAYERSWLACEVIADAAGEDGLLRLRRLVAAGRPVGVALRQVADLSRAELVALWRQRLARLAG